MLDLISRAWKFYRRYGLVSLVLAASRGRHRLLPFRYRIELRRALNEWRYGPGAVTRPLRVHWIRSARIRYNGPIFSHDRYVGAVRGGSWDEKSSPLAEQEMYQGLHDRFAKGYEWEQTRYYRLAKRNFESDGQWLGYTSLESFERNRLPYLDRLHRDIAQNGYKLQSELDGDNRDNRRHDTVPDYHQRINEITCNVARDGELLLNNGIHRLSIANALRLDEIPIQIVVRHREWQNVRTRVAAADHPTDVARDHDVDPEHPDLEHVRST